MSKKVQNTPGFGAEKFGSLINWEDLDGLMGRLLTHVDATIMDPVAREAQKSIVKSIVRDWMRDCDNHFVWGYLHASAESQAGSDDMSYSLNRDKLSNSPVTGSVN